MYRSATLRQQIINELEYSEEPLSIRDLSKMVRISEKEVVSHLDHIDKSLRRERRKLIKEPSSCKKCGFEFTKRKDFKRPSRCPMCRNEYISEPLFSIESFMTP